MTSARTRLVLAPLFGVSAARFRKVYSRHFKGFSSAMAPFIATTHGKSPSLSHFKDINPAENVGSLPLVPQLMGRDPDAFAAAANRMREEFGYDEVNWNIGCPAARVTSRKRGAGLLPHPDMVDSFLDRVCGRLKCGLSVKMRLGLRDPDECLRLVPVLNRHPIREITIHPRTGAQMYGGYVDLERFGALLSALRPPVVYNGDITTPRFAREILGRFPGVAGLMIGRGAIANPLLAELTQSGAEFSASDLIPRLRDFHDEFVGEYRRDVRRGDGALLGMMKELWKSWAPNFADGGEILRLILGAGSMEEYDEVCRRAFSEASPSLEASFEKRL